MQPYQEEYIANCQTIRTLTAPPTIGDLPFERVFDATMETMKQARALFQRNMELLTEYLLPLLDNLYAQTDDVLWELESFGDALVAKPQVLDMALACQIHEAILSCARHTKNKDVVIRLLYKVGMDRFGYWQMLNGSEMPQMDRFSVPMRYCFAEAGSYLKYYDEFTCEETKAYILRSVANCYLGYFKDWRERIKRVRYSMQVFQDEQYRAGAPGLPWNSYMISLHRQMTSVLPHGFRAGSLSVDEVTDIMESAHLIYEKQHEKAKESGRPVKVTGLLSFYALEFGCSLISKEEFLAAVETLMNEADASSYDEDTEYQILSLPAFYVAYIKEMPEMIQPRESYITGLYQRMLHYIAKMPSDCVTDTTRSRIRHILGSYLEIKDGISYRQMALALFSRFSPDLYAHGHAVGGMAKLLCKAIYAEEPDFFDDIPTFAAMPDGKEKEAAILEYAYNAGLFHDIGRLNFSVLYSNAGRQRLRREQDALELHPYLGRKWLRETDSTKCYIDVAFGHHRWYDESDGYPEEYHRNESPYRAMVDVVALMDYLEKEERDDSYILLHTTPFHEKAEKAMKLSGRRFSPLVTGWLRDEKLAKQLEALYINGRRDGYYQCFKQSMQQES